MADQARAGVRRLDAATHESVMTEKRGLFRIICGCGWTSDFADEALIETDFDAHMGEARRGEL